MDLLFKYLWVWQQCYPRCAHLVICVDGSRFGGKEVQVSMIGGQNPEGEVLFAWAPPVVVWVG
eukprot:11227315-Lingulodinium_polyedra.AAC.1